MLVLFWILIDLDLGQSDAEFLEVGQRYEIFMILEEIENAVLHMIIKDHPQGLRVHKTLNEMYVILDFLGCDLSMPQEMPFQDVYHWHLWIISKTAQSILVQVVNYIKVVL